MCFSESFEALVRRAGACLWQLGGVPQQHRTDHLSAAVRDWIATGRHEFTERYGALLAHYGMEPTTNNAGVAHENGDVEQAHFRFKQAVDQALRVRGSRDFPDRAAYAGSWPSWSASAISRATARWAEERAALRPLPAAPLALCRELPVRGQPLQHHPGAAQHLLGAVAPDRRDAAGAGARRDAGGLPRHGASC